MKIEVNIEKKYAFAIIGILIVIASIITGYAFSSSGTGGNPAIAGHSVDEVDWSKNIIITGNISVGGYGRTPDTGFPAGWGHGISAQGVSAVGINAESMLCINGDCKNAWSQVESSGTRINYSDCTTVGGVKASCGMNCPTGYVMTGFSTGASCGYPPANGDTLYQSSMTCCKLI